MKNLTVEEARGRMLAGLAPTPQTIPMDASAIGRVLAEPILAIRDQPPFDASAMDGWAVRRADAAEAETSLRIAGESAAGAGYAAALRPGEAVRIFTGAPVPEGADMICIQENATREGDQVRMGPLADAPSYLRPRGGGFKAGAALLNAGDRLDPARLSLAAAAGRAEAKVARRPRVAFLATGTEIVAPGRDPGPWQIFDSNTVGLVAMAQGWGADAWKLEAAGDDADAIAGMVRDVDCDLIVTIGGASVGDYDLVKPALERLGLEQTVGSIAVRPGKPTWFGTLKDGRRVLGLPGNPASAFVCAELFLRPILTAWQGANAEQAMIAARLTKAIAPAGPREHWMRAKLSVDADGSLGAEPYPDQDSSLIKVLSDADALVRRRAGSPAAQAGERVDVLRLERL